MPADLVSQFDAIIRRDPARRGLISSEAEFGPLCAGHLARAAEHLANRGRTVVIVTGFFVPKGEVAAAETDGPLGALVLAATLQKLGMKPFVLTDRHCVGALAAAARAIEFPDGQMLTAPDDVENWLPGFFAGREMESLSHLIAVERVGPSHTHDSIKKQKGNPPDAVADFLARVPPESRDRCHNMRGDAIDSHTASLHLLFEQCRQFRPDVTTIGIGDGANEIGMGAIPWWELARRLPGDVAPRIPCRIATDCNIVAGTSNWGAYALSASLAVLRGCTDILRPWGAEHQRRMIEAVVKEGPAVDGLTRRREATVDGLPFATFIQPWIQLRRLLGLDD